jgi:hypothetical protein
MNLTKKRIARGGDRDVVEEDEPRPTHGDKRLALLFQRGLERRERDYWARRALAVHQKGRGGPAALGRRAKEYAKEYKGSVGHTEGR